MREKASLGDAVWQAVPHPVVVVDQDGLIREVNAAARTLLPAATPGARWSAEVIEAHPTPLPDGSTAWWLSADTDRKLRDTREALARERARAAFLDDASAVLMSSLNVERCMEATAQMAARNLADAAVVVAPETGRELHLVHSGPGGSAHRLNVDEDPADVPGLPEALRGFPPVPSRPLDPALLPEWLVPRHLAGLVGSVLITPLPGHGVAAGALVLLRHESQPRFSESDDLYARLFAARAGAALSAARLYAEQASITRTLMRDLMPPRLERLDDFELAGGYRASADHELVGGDFYDVHPAATPDGETLVVLGDVCGKGLDAAVLTGKIRNTLQALAPLADQHEWVLRLLNSALLSPENARFATVVLASIARRDGQVALRLTCAGHPAPLIVRNDGTVEEADTRGMLVGALPQFRARSFETTLAPGETCLLYTDGLTEARGGPLGGEVFGDERLAAAMAQCAGLPAEAVVERMMMLASEWVSDREHDDMAVVAITAPRRTHLSAVDGHTPGRYIA